MKEYKGVMDGVDEAAVFYSRHALELKRMPELAKSVVENGFKKNGLNVFNSKKELESWLESRNYNNAVILFMSSGNYEGIDTQEFAKKITVS